MTGKVVRLSPSLRNFLSVTSVYANDPYNPVEFDLGAPYEFIPTLPGVLVLVGDDGKAISIEACDRNMRQRAIECWKGLGGVDAVGAVRIAYETSASPGIREGELVQEHRRIFGVLPRKNRA